MTDIEVLLTDLGEIATRDIAQTEHPQGFNENMNVAKEEDKLQMMPENHMKNKLKNQQFQKIMH